MRRGEAIGFTEIGEDVTLLAARLLEPIARFLLQRIVRLRRAAARHSRHQPRAPTRPPPGVRNGVAKPPTVEANGALMLAPDIAELAPNILIRFSVSSESDDWIAWIC